MSIKIGHHGGYCCGIKVIHGFPADPDNWEWPKDRGDDSIMSEDRECGAPESRSVNFYLPSRPKETGRERFAHMIEWLGEVRHYGLVECVIVTPVKGAVNPVLEGTTAEELELGLIGTYEEAVAIGTDRVLVDDYYEEETVLDDYREEAYSGCGQSRWEPVFEEHGFKKVSTFPNINSGNMVSVYHLVMDGAYHKNKKKKEKK